MLIVAGTVLVLATGAAFYLVGRSEDRERAREARGAAPGEPGDRPRAPRRPPRRRDHG